MNGNKNYKTKIAGTLLGLTMAVTLGATPAYAVDPDVYGSYKSTSYGVDSSGSANMLKKIKTDGINSGNDFEPKSISTVQWSSDAGAQVQMDFYHDALKQVFPGVADTTWSRKKGPSGHIDVIKDIYAARAKIKLKLARVMDEKTLNDKQYQDISIGDADNISAGELGSFCGSSGKAYGALVYKVASVDEVNTFYYNSRGKYAHPAFGGTCASDYPQGGGSVKMPLKNDPGTSHAKQISPSDLNSDYKKSSSVPDSLNIECYSAGPDVSFEEAYQRQVASKQNGSAKTAAEYRNSANNLIKDMYINDENSSSYSVAVSGTRANNDYSNQGRNEVHRKFTSEVTGNLVPSVCAYGEKRNPKSMDLECPLSVDVKVGSTTKNVSIWDKVSGSAKYNGSSWTPQACYEAQQILENAKGGANGLFTPELKELLGDDYLKNHTSYDIDVKVNYRKIKCQSKQGSGYEVILENEGQGETSQYKDMLCDNGETKSTTLDKLTCTAKTDSSNDKNSGKGNYCLQDADWGDTDKEDNDKPDLDENGAPVAQGAGSAKQGDKSVSDPLNFPRLGGETMQGTDGKTHTVPGNSEGNGAISKTAPGTKPAPKGNGLTNDTFVSKAKDQKAYSAAKAEKQKETAKADANKKQGELRSVPEDANLPGEFLPSYTCDTDNLNGINGTQAFTAGIVRGQSGDLTLTTPKPRAINGYELKDVKLLEMNLLRDSESTPWEPTTDFANQPLSDKALTIGYGDEKQVLTGKGQATNWYYTDKDTNTFTIKGMDASKDGKPTIIQPQYRYTAQILTPQRVLTNMSIRNGQIIPTYEWRKIWTPTTLACRAPAINLGVLTTGANGANGGGEKPLTNAELKSKPTENGYSYYGENTWGKNKGEISENGKH